MERIIRNQLTSPAVTGEINSGYIVTVPDQSMSISEILEYSLEHTEVLEPIPDVPYGLDLTDIYPNVEEFPNTDNNFNPINSVENENLESYHEGSEDTSRNRNNREGRVGEDSLESVNSEKATPKQQATPPE